jgi:hypothetical protein
MVDTAFTRARESFANLKTTFAQTSTRQSQDEIVFDPPGLYRIKVRFQSAPENPMLHIVKEGKNAAPDPLAFGESPELTPESISFNAFFDGTDFGWVSSSDLDPPRDDEEIESLIRAIL